MTMRRACLILLLCACAGSEDARDAGSFVDAGTTDAGTGPTALPLPLLRMDEVLSGTTHTTAFTGVVQEHGPSRSDPFEELTPARRLEVRLVDGSRREVWYTLPVPFGFAAFPNEQVDVVYRERVAHSGGSSYGLFATTITGELRILVEDGAWGVAFDEENPLGFEFELDLGQPLESTTVQCGVRVRYPVLVKNGDKRRRLFPGEEEPYETSAGSARFVLLDAWRLEDSLCGDAPAVSLGYLVLPPR